MYPSASKNEYLFSASDSQWTRRKLWLRRDLSLMESRLVHAAISNKTLPASSLCDLSADKAMMNGVCTVNHLRCEPLDCCPELTLILFIIFWMGNERQDSEGKPLRVEAPGCSNSLYKSIVLSQLVDKARKFYIHVSALITGRQSRTSDTQRRTRVQEKCKA